MSFLHRMEKEEQKNLDYRRGAKKLDYCREAKRHHPKESWIDETGRRNDPTENERRS